jgi:NADPH-dependent 2,4-dienoyl-CoA reductase/sulfur reductase-like enzyme
MSKQIVVDGAKSAGSSKRSGATIKGGNGVHIVVVGASHAGISAAVALRKKLPGSKITLIEQGDDRGVSFVGADGLLWVSGDIEEQHMVYTNCEKTLAKGIDFKTSTTVQEVDLAQKKVIVQNNTTYDYDYLILATGSNPIIPQSALVGDQLSPDTITMKTLQDAHKMKQFVIDENCQRIGVIGGGYIGVETAETLRKRGKEVALFQGGGTILNTYYDAEFAIHAQNVLEREGVQIYLNTRFEGFDSLEDDQKCDAYVMALGFKPEATLAPELKRVSGAYDVDELQRTSDESVYAIGDCSISYSNAIQDKMYIAIGSNTARESSIVAEAITAKALGEQRNFMNRGTQGSNALSVFGLNLSSTGLTVSSAKRFGIEADFVEYTGSQLAPYLPPRIMGGVTELEALSGGKVQLRIVFDRVTRRLVGAQMATHTDVIYAMHLFSLAIERHLNVDDLRNLDLFFLPQVNQLYNVLTRALNKLDTRC